MKTNYQKKLEQLDIGILMMELVVEAGRQLFGASTIKIAKNKSVSNNDQKIIPAKAKKTLAKLRTSFLEVA